MQLVAQHVTVRKVDFETCLLSQNFLMWTQKLQHVRNVRLICLFHVYDRKKLHVSGVLKNQISVSILKTKSGIDQALLMNLLMHA